MFDGLYAPLLNQFTPSELKLLHGLLNKHINCPMTSSIGRLFDAFASLLGLCQINEFEGQAAIALESRAGHQYSIVQQHDLIFDWQPLLLELCSEKQSVEQLASALHQALADWLFTVAEKINVQTLALSGGCFQNAQLVERVLRHSAAKNYCIYHSVNIPPNDGGLALGQIYARVL